MRGAPFTVTTSPLPCMLSAGGNVTILPRGAREKYKNKYKLFLPLCLSTTPRKRVRKFTFNLATKQKIVVSFTLQPLYPRGNNLSGYKAQLVPQPAST